MRNKKIKTFYNIKQVCFDSIEKESYSKSPLKPYLLFERIKDKNLCELLEIQSDFKPYDKEDFYIAHTKEYVNNVWNKQGNYNSNRVPWSENLVESLTYTNASLYEAKKYAILNPSTVTFAPVSGMHHARPDAGSGFCTFSGQVISAVKLYREFGAVGVYLDLDAHYGNSIEDSRKFVPELEYAIPRGFNINPVLEGIKYRQYFEDELNRIKKDVISGNINYVVFAHGADSHIDDDLHGQCDTDTWVGNAKLFADWVNEISDFMGKPLPVILTLFGGYRKDNYNAVLDLHIKSLITVSNMICDNQYIDDIQIPAK